jgi:AGZA family xanthine/uracil permease-like MFS transporter
LIKAAAFALAAAACTFVGLMHGEAIGIAKSLPVAFSYLTVAGILFVLAKYAKVTMTSTDSH